MLKRIYIDNFRCFVNFELTVDSINLFLGPNGAGKSTVFDVLRKIQAFINGNKVVQVFYPENLTRWQTSPVQSFEMEIEGNEGVYKYELAIEHDESRQQARVDYERLWFNNKPLLKVETGDAQLYRDDHSEGPSYPFDWSQSLVASLPERHDNTRLVWFRKRLERLIIVQINPTMMDPGSSRQEKLLGAKAQNFTSWYRYVSQNQGKSFVITEALREILDGFSHFNFEEFSEQHRDFRAYFQTESDKRNTIEYRFNELSDGQRVLIALYSLVYYAQSEGYTLCIDEPGNYLSLSEIQPWLTLVYDLCDDNELQALLISHHPKLIDHLASYAGYWFDRESNKPVRVKKITEETNGGVSISELVARGWLYG